MILLHKGKLLAAPNRRLMLQFYIHIFIECKFITEIFKWEKDVSKLLCLHRDAAAYPIVSGQRQGNTLNGWPVHHRGTVIHTAYKSNAQKVLRQTVEIVCVSAVEMMSQRLCLQSSMIQTDHISPVHCSTLWSSCTCSGNSTFMKHVVLSLNLIEMQWHLVAIWGEGHAIQYIQPCLIYDIQWCSNTAFKSHGSRLWVIHQ